MNRLPIVSAVAVLLAGCSLAGNQDVRAYNACVSRHPQDVVVCEGPRQAYEIDDFTFSARSAAIGDSYEEGLAVPVSPPAPMLLHPDPMRVTLGLNGHDPCMVMGQMMTICP